MYHRKRKITKHGIAELFFVCVIAAAFLYMVATGLKSNTNIMQNTLSALSEGWYYFDGSKKIAVTLPSVVEKEGDSLILYNDSLSEEEEGKTLTTKGAQYNLKIIFADQTLYEYSDESFPRNDQMKSKMFCDAVLPKKITGGQLELHYENTHQGIYELDKIFLGTDQAVWKQHCWSSFIPLTISFVMLVLAFLAVGVEIYLHHVHMGDRRFLNVACFLLICSIWCLTDSAVFQQIKGNYEEVCIISFYAFMLLAIPMLHFVKNTGEIKKYKIIDWMIGVFYLNAIMQGVLNWFHIFDFVDMLFATHLFLIIGIAITSVLLQKEYKKNPNREIRSVIWAFLFLAACGLLALLMYWLLQISYYSIIFDFGILIFVFILLSVIVLNMADNFRFKTEMIVYQRLAKEDRLTGIGNRRAFDEKVTELVNHAEQYQNIALVFMDLNGLKKINDTYGHNAGDEMIIASAGCIKNTFSHMGFSYRIGGDEFCVILPNPTGTEEEWFEKMDQEILRYNNGSRYKISLARGVSYIRDENADLKTVGDWKYEADQNMYKDKIRRK